MPAPLLDLENISLVLPDDPAKRTVLRNISLRVTHGEHCALFGPNGAGKSSLLRLMAGELWATAGRIVWYGPDGLGETSPLAGRAATALLSPAQQETYQRQGWGITGRELLLTGFDSTPLLYAPQNEARHNHVEALACQLKAEDLLNRPLPVLSQGQLRLLLLGRALISQPPLLLLDEWIDGLDATHARHCLAALEYYSQNITVFMTAHRPNLVPSWCSGRLQLQSGRLHADSTSGGACAAESKGTPTIARTLATDQGHNFEHNPGQGLRLNPSQKTAAGLDAHAGLPPKPALDHSPTSSPTFSPDYLHEHSFEHTAVSSAGRGLLLALENVSVYIERHKVLHNITWSLHAGEHWHITGANGSGKSSLLRLLAGDEFAAEGGNLHYFAPGSSEPATTLDDLRQGIHLVSDLSQALYGYAVSGLELVCSGFDGSIGVYRSYSEAEHLEAQQRMGEMFPEGGVEEIAMQSIRRLSSGQVRRLFLARALMGRPHILLLDEPCTGLDSASRARFLSLLDDLAGRGIQLIFVSHHDEDAPLCINRRAHMACGRLRVLA